MGIERHIVLIIISIVLYVFLINFFSMNYVGGIISGEYLIGTVPFLERTGFSHSVDVSVLSKRIYGKVIEVPGNQRTLFLFNIIPIPILIQGYSFKLVHWVFISIIILWLILVIWKQRVFQSKPISESPKDPSGLDKAYKPEKDKNYT